MSGSYAYYSGNPPGLPADTYHFGLGSLGALGSEIPSSGEHGPGYLYPSLNLPADADKEYYGPLGDHSADLDLEVDEYSRVLASANDGQYVVPFTLYEMGQPLGDTAFTLNFGVVGAVVNLAGANCAQANASSSGSVAVTQGPAVISLIGANCIQAATSSAGTVSIIPGSQTINLAGADCAQAATSGTGAVTVTQNTYARAPAGSGYVPKRHECGCRPFVTQRNHR